MLNLQGYAHIKLIGELREYLVYSALRDMDQQPVQLRTLRSTRPTTEAIARVYHEYNIKKDLDFPSVLKCFELIDSQGQYVLVEEDVHGIFLNDYLQKNPINDLSIFFNLALQMTAIISQLHQHHIIHKDINVHNFIINPKTLMLKITGFSVASQLLHEVKSISAPEKLEGTLAYIAPEQTGRMNMAIDYRVDFYSLGVLFYEMLTGGLPFDYSDPLELMHAHLANRPPKVASSEMEIPGVLEAIVHKLMAKSPSDRYQSALGLQADLECAQKAFETTGNIESFPLGERDIFDRLNIPHKIYGRELEEKALITAYERVSQGAVECLMVSGHSGIGKSMLINEVHKPMVQHRGYFIKGKFDQLVRNTPYTAITDAFHQLVRLILAEPEARFSQIKNDILNALDGVAQVILDFAPNLELIIGPQPPLEKLPPAENENRMMVFFKRFMRAIANRHHPLVIFIDDLQWIDRASLKLFHYILTDEELTHVLLIGAYRENQIDEDHILTQFFKEIQNTEKNIQKLTLKPLTTSNFENLLKDLLHRDDSNVKRLAELIHNRTGGNPFFANQVINTFYSENLIFFDYNRGEWDWDLAKLTDAKITNNVVDLMLSKLAKLPKKTIHYLNQAACIGNQFTAETLSVISGETIENISQGLWPALQEELILPIGNYNLIQDISKHDLLAPLSEEIRFRFIHDKVQEAAYKNLSDKDKESNHLNIARLLKKKNSDLSRRELIFEVVDHFNYAQNLLSETEKLEVLNLNYLAALQARASNAYEAMRHYLASALHLLNENFWDSDYELCFSVHCEYVWSLFLLNNISEAMEFSNRSLTRAKTNLDKVKLYRIQSKIYHSQGRLDDVFKTTRQSLTLLGVYCAEKPKKIDLFLKRIHIKWKMRRSHLERLADELPNLTDPNIIAVFEILGEVINPLATKGANLATYLIKLGIELMLRHGKPKSAAYYMTVWVTLDRVFYNNSAILPQYWALIERLLDEFPEKYNSGLVYMAFAFCWCHFVFPIKVSRNFALRAIQDCTESGNRLSAASAKSTLLLSIRAEARSLKDIQEALKSVLKAYIENGIKDSVERFKHSTILYENLQLGEHSREEDLKALREIIIREHSQITRRFVFRELSAYYFFFDLFEQADLYANWWDSKKYLGIYDALLAQEIALHALTITKLYPQANVLNRLKYRLRLRQIESNLKWISRISPQNYLHCYLCVKGARLALKSDFEAASDFFDQAIENAKKSDFYLWAALANELSAEMLMKNNKPRFAKDYIFEARYYYERFGMMAKVKAIERRYAEYFIEQRAIQGGSSTTSVALDFMSIIKASQTISGEIMLEKLLEKMLHIVVENAGAEKSLFIEKNKDTWNVIARLTQEQNQEQFEILNSPLVEFQNLPQSVIHYCLRSEEAVVLSNALEDEQYREDPYIVEMKPKSVLSLPLLHQNKVVGLIYLENNLSTGVFTEDRITVLTSLASQIAISLQNARHFEIMQNLFHSTERFVPKAFLSLLKKETIEDIKVGESAKVELAPMFADIRNFTTISEAIGTEKTAYLLNAYMQTMSPIIRRRHGFVSQFFGDGIMALFPRKHVDAVDAAIEMRTALTSFNERIQIEGFEPIEIGIGINAGSAMLITLGEEERIDASVVSDVVNSASRIEGLNKLYGTGVLISDMVYQSIKHPERYLIRRVDKVKVKGKTRAMGLYEVMILDQEENRPKWQAYILEFDRAFEHYDAADFSAAKKGFDRCLEEHPVDTVALVLKKRCETFLSLGIPQNWDGTYTALEK